uniref:Secreted protein n=1 Tax=Steinernema glaseri TaxID=37863 RepID=A0A1I7YS30_9BILA
MTSESLRAEGGSGQVSYLLLHARAMVALCLILQTANVRVSSFFFPHLPLAATPLPRQESPPVRDFTETESCSVRQFYHDEFLL